MWLRYSDVRSTACAVQCFHVVCIFHRGHLGLLLCSGDLQDFLL